LDEAAAAAIGSLVGVLHSYDRNDRDSVAAAKVILDAVFKKAKLYNIGQRPGGVEGKGKAHEQGHGLEGTGGSPHPITEEESTADASDRVHCSTPDHRPPNRRKFRSDTEVHARAERAGEEEPAAVYPMRIHRRDRRGDHEDGAGKEGATQQ
jgi:hypothetical protein